METGDKILGTYQIPAAVFVEGLKHDPQFGEESLQFCGLVGGLHFLVGFALGGIRCVVAWEIVGCRPIVRPSHCSCALRPLRTRPPL